MQYSDDVAAAQAFREAMAALRTEISKSVVGQEETVSLLLTSIFCQGHCLLVGVPGLAKTLLVQTMASALALDFNRIQFTPDLMPSDILGAETLDKDRNLTFIPGPVFANIILADEINRTPPKTQSALLESMQEYQVTVAGTRYPLPRPFFVLATQNPIEQEGTYPLPEAQLDRFMFMVTLDYPTFQQELAIVKNTTSDQKITISPVIRAEEIAYFQQLVRRVPVADNVIEYAVRLVHKTRPGLSETPDMTNTYLEWGAGPRASQSLVLAAKCHALISGRFSPDIADVRAIAKPVLRHRLVRNFKAEAEGKTVDDLIQALL